MYYDKLKSYAKVNLSLRVLKKLKNNYHRIESIVSFINLHDLIRIKLINGKKNKIIFHGRFSKNIPKNNTVSNLLNILEKESFLKNKYFIKIKKNIPQKSGLGGGSSNASSLLNYFIKKNKIKLTESEIVKIANKIGSDVALSLKKNNSILLSNGKIIRLNSKFNFYTLIIKPKFGCSTKFIYKNVNKYSKPLFTKNTRIKKLNILVNQKNDLEKVAFKHYPNLKKIKKTMENLANVFFVRMSGSGSSLVAYFSSKKASLIAIKILKKKYKNYWCILSKTI